MKEYTEYDSAGHPHKVREREPVASPQATAFSVNNSLERERFPIGQQWNAEAAAQPAAGTTPQGIILHTVHRAEGGADTCLACKLESAKPSEGTTPQAERPNEIVSEMLKLPCGCNADSDDPKGPIFWNPFNKAVQCHKCGHSYELAHAVAPVETANFVQLLPGGMCFAHGRYEGYQCPQWPKCITDPQKQEYLAQAQTLNATTFGDAGEG